MGSLPSPEGLDEATPGDEGAVRGAVEGGRKQREIGLDVINEGEYTKGGDWLSFIESRFGGFEGGESPSGRAAADRAGQGPRGSSLSSTRTALERRRQPVLCTREQPIRVNPYWVCVGPGYAQRPVRAGARDRPRQRGGGH